MEKLEAGGLELVARALDAGSADPERTAEALSRVRRVEAAIGGSG